MPITPEIIFRYKTKDMQRPVLLVQLLLGVLIFNCAQAAKVDDIRIVIDVSGSMLKTDPQNLRAPALRMINGLLPTGANAGVWTFGQYANMEVKWGKVNDRWRKLADQGAAKIHSRGQFTNIERALKRATSGWEKPDPDTQRNLIFLTDGKVDISRDPLKNTRSRNHVLNKTIPELVNNGVKVHAIALSRFTDETLLRRMALKTSGSFEIAHTAKDLQRIFLRMFERATKPDTVPLVDNRFTIDKSINEMTLLVFRNSKKPTRLIGPGKKSHSQKKHGGQVSWRNEQGYDLITVTKPASGVWSLDAENDPDNRVMIVTDLKLLVDDLPAYSTPDKSLNLSVELHNKNKKISKNSFLKFVDFKVDHKVSDNTQTLPLTLKKSRQVKDKGIYLQQLQAPLEEGRHTIVVKADSRTFNRTKQFTIEVQWPISVEITKTSETAVYELRVKARDEYINGETLQLKASLQLPDGQQQKVELTIAFNQWTAQLKVNSRDGLHLLHLSMQAQSVEGETVRHTLEPYPVLGVKTETEKAPEPIAEEDKQPALSSDAENPEIESLEPAESEQGSEWTATIITIFMANIVIILLGVGVFIFMRKQARQDEIDLIGEQELSDD